jgi:GntR family transcriptional regulator/MocR family aminotransferase
MRAVYAERHQLVTDGLRRRFAGHLEVIPSAIGLHVTATARVLSAGQIDEVVSRAAAAGVEAQALAPFGVSAPGPPGLVVGYGAIPTERIAEGLGRLRRCFDDS